MGVVTHTLHVRAENRRVDGTHGDGLTDVVLHGVHNVAADDQTLAADRRDEETEGILVGPGAAASRAAPVGKQDGAALVPTAKDWRGHAGA